MRMHRLSLAPLLQSFESCYKLDNSATFQSDLLVNACKEWGVRVIYRAAHRPAGNGIIERHHRTVKRMAARCDESPLMAVYWYNYLPLFARQSSSAPHRQLFRRQWRNPLLPARGLRPRMPNAGGFAEGDVVLVKPPGAKCTTPWSMGAVTGVTEENAIEVDDVHPHVADLRRFRLESTSSESVLSEDDAVFEHRRSTRITATPRRYCNSDYDF